jgi:predicted phage tail protein
MGCYAVGGIWTLIFFVVLWPVDLFVCTWRYNWGRSHVFLTLTLLGVFTRTSEYRVKYRGLTAGSYKVRLSNLIPYGVDGSISSLVKSLDGCGNVQPIVTR